MQPSANPSDIHKKDKPEKRRLSLRLRLYVMFWAVILIGFGIVISNQMVELETLGLDKAAAQALVDAERSTTQELRLTYEAHMSYSFIEQVARERLGFIRADEIIFINDAN